jgi:hypothetical protein
MYYTDGILNVPQRWGEAGILNVPQRWREASIPFSANERFTQKGLRFYKK